MFIYKSCCISAAREARYWKVQVAPFIAEARRKFVANLTVFFLWSGGDDQGGEEDPEDEFVASRSRKFAHAVSQAAGCHLLALAGVAGHVARGPVVF